MHNGQAACRQVCAHAADHALAGGERALALALAFALALALVAVAVAAPRAHAAVGPTREYERSTVRA